MFCRSSLLNRGLRVLVTVPDRQRSALHVLAASTNLLVDKGHVVVVSSGNPIHLGGSPLAECYHQFAISQARTYITRAHPQPKPTYSINKAIQMLLVDAQERLERRIAKGIRNGKEMIRNKEKKHPDETVEMVFQLNLDPRKPNQSLRGSINLPHGSGRKLSCIVFTDDEELAKQALEMGAAHAGGEGLVEQIASGAVAVDNIDRSLGTPAIMPDLSKRVARILGPRGLMPNAKTGTLFTTGEELLAGLKTQMMGKEIQYRTEKEGQVLVPVGKVSFGMEKLLDNIGEVIKEINNVKPDQYGKGKRSKKSTKNPKYLLHAHVSTTQGPGVKLDLKTIDPTSPLFLTDPDLIAAQAAEKVTVSATSETW